MEEEYDIYKLAELVGEIDDSGGWMFDIEFSINNKIFPIKKLEVQKVRMDHNNKKCTVFIEESNEKF